MLERLEPVLQRLGVRVVLVEGDTNSVLAGALAAAKLDIRVGHVEAGLRSRDRSMPEELNRIVADHLADHLYAPTEEAVANLRREGIDGERVRLTGNTVVDACRRHLPRAKPESVLERRGLAAGGYLLVTVHRQENTDRAERLSAILDGVLGSSEASGLPAVFPIHPRTVKAVESAGLRSRLETVTALRTTEPLGYLEFLALLAHAGVALTDSGGVQEEACILGVPCVTLRDNTERPETLAVGANRLAGADSTRIVESTLSALAGGHAWAQPFGDGRAGRRIAEHVVSLLG
jgi:UDP-N-acetylglucosamine 2-epimerase (non-hydrolysing)